MPTLLLSYRAHNRLLIRLLFTFTLLVIYGIFSSFPGYAQPLTPNPLWVDVVESRLAAGSERPIVPQRYRLMALDVQMLQAQLAAAPLEGTVTARSASLLLTLPLPDGGFGRFQIVESPIMAPELAAKFPEIKTYAGQGVDDPTATVRLDWTPAGFHALILAATATIYIDPYQRNDLTHYISYFKHDFTPPLSKQLVELPPRVLDAKQAAARAALVAQGVGRSSGAQLRTYRLAVATTGEYTAFQGGTVSKGLAAVVTTVNRVTGIYERDVAIRLSLVANNNLLIYTNANSDPYTNDDDNALLDENQANLDNVIGSANYDIGHVFSTAGGGLAALGVPCSNGSKAQGETGTSSPVGDPYDIDYVAHEMGHQFGADHSFNGNAGSCGGNRNTTTAYEPGSGSTIMGYAGICDNQDLQAHSDALFHSVSFDQIVVYSTQDEGNTCPVITNTANTPPVANAGAGYTIPKQTPFTLTGSATDANNDTLTYEWEAFDLGTAGASSSTNPPFFRAFLPTTSPSRTFPQWSDLVNNTTTIGEILPNVTRTLNFRLIVRDNRSGGGGVDYASTTVNVTTAAGPFAVTAPNTAVTWAGGSSQTVTWNVAGTNNAPVSCSSVNIRLSTDGGYTYPTMLASSVANNGAATITVPQQTTTTARVQVACATNIFFDIANVNFTITSNATATPTPTPGAPTTTPTPTHTLAGTLTPTATAATPTATPATQTVAARVNTSADDVEEAVANGAMYLDSSDLELVNDPTFWGNQTVGIRFTGLTVPRGATILNAAIEFETKEVSQDTTAVTFFAQASDNAPAFTSATYNVSSRTKSAASVAWNNIPAWSTLNEKHLSPNLASIVQEVVNRSGWTAGNSMVFIITGTGTRTAKAYDGYPTSAPLLQITYSTGNAPTATPTAVTTATSTPAAQSIHFGVVGDFGADTAAEGDVAAMLAGHNLDFMVTVGDNRYGAITFDRAVGRYYCNYLTNVTSGTYCAGGNSAVNAFFPALGNHDYDDGGGLAEYLNYFTLPGAGIATSGTSGNERYYDMIKGPVHFFFLDSDAAIYDATDRAAQQAWLQSRLAASTTRWQLVIFHHAAYSSSSHGSSTTMQWPYASWGADAVLTGHDHTYERIFQNGIPYFVNGLGGASIYPFASVVAGSQVRYNSDYGAMVVDADNSAMTFRFLNRANGEVDSYTITAAATATPTPATTATLTLTPPTPPTATTTHTPTLTPVTTNTATPMHTMTPTATPTAIPSATPNATPATGPLLTLGTAVPGHAGALVALPVAFAANSHAIAQVVFSIDFDQICLAFDPTDADNNGMPDAIHLTLAPGFTGTATVDLTDTAGELDFVVSDMTQPLAPLPTGVLMTIDFTVRTTAACQPTAPATYLAAVNFAADPPASFGSTTGASVPGQTANGSVVITAFQPGDCNGDVLVDAGDIAANVLEIFDKDGTFWLDAPGGTFLGNASCDANQDTIIDAGDIACTLLIIFEGTPACTTPGLKAAQANAVGLTVGAVQPGVARDFVQVPVQLTTNGATVHTAIFALHYDPSRLTFDPADANGDGLPDAIAIGQPTGGRQLTVQVDTQTAQINLFLADVTRAPVAFVDGTLLTITFGRPAAQADTDLTGAVTFSPALAASFGSRAGLSVPVLTQTVDGASTSQIYLPWVATQ